MLILNELLFGFQSTFDIVFFFKTNMSCGTRRLKINQKRQGKRAKRPNFASSKGFIKPNSISEPPSEQESFTKSLSLTFLWFSHLSIQT